ncbi:primase-helicase zinc-binding domain-containing protein [Desulfovibrio caledoniensis]
MPVELIELVRARVPGGFDRPLGGRGEYQGPCPVCGGTDRFRVFPDQAPSGDVAERAGVSGGYWCRQCGLSGDYVQWLVDVEGWDWTKIFDFLSVEGEAAGPASAKRERQRRDPAGRTLDQLNPVTFPPLKWQEHARKFVEECAARLQSNPHLLQWLEHRGVPLDIAQAYQLGWHAGEPQRNGPPCIYRNREGWGLDKRINKRTGRLQSIWIPRGLVIPNERDGQLAAVRIRRPNQDLGENDDKYILVAGSEQKVIMITPNARAYVVTEAGLCGLAVMATRQPGVGMCAMGTLSMYPDQQAAGWLAAATGILNAVDFEPQGKGEQYGNKFRFWWDQRYPQCRRTPVPAGKDPGEFVELHGLSALGAWIRSQLSPVIRVTAPPPRGNVTAAPPPKDKKLQIPDDVEALRLLLATNRLEIHVGENGNLLGCRGPAEIHDRVALLAHRPVVARWLREIGECEVTIRNFLKPLESGNER